MKPHELLVPEIHTYYKSLQKLSVGLFILFTTMIGLSFAVNEFNEATAHHQGTYAY